MQVVDRKGNQVQHTLLSYQVRYFNVWKELRTVEHQGNKLTEQALRYFDSREQGICIYIDKLIASNAVNGATVCVNGVSLWKL